MKLKLHTGLKTKLGAEVRLGDRLKGKNTHEVIVLLNEDDTGFVIEPVEENFKWYSQDLKDFLDAWYDIEVLGNINRRVHKEYF